MASKVWITIDAGDSMGIASIEGDELRGKAYKVKGKSVRHQQAKVRDAIKDYLLNEIAFDPKNENKYIVSILYTRFLHPLKSKQDAMTMAANLKLTELALEEEFDEGEIDTLSQITRIDDLSARSIVFLGRRLSKIEAHNLLDDRFDLSKVGANTRGRIVGDTKDAIVGVLSQASRGGVDIQIFEKER